MVNGESIRLNDRFVAAHNVYEYQNIEIVSAPFRCKFRKLLSSPLHLISLILLLVFFLIEKPREKRGKVYVANLNLLIFYVLKSRQKTAVKTVD